MDLGLGWAWTWDFGISFSTLVKYNKKYPSLDAEKFAKNNNKKLLLSIKTGELIKMNITTIMVQENTAQNSLREGCKASSWTS